MNDEATRAEELPSRSKASSGRLRELAALFLKLGSISFGGPAAHIAMMETEVVREREWLTRQEFLDLLGAANLIPGPTSTEMAISVGFVRAGWAGLCVSGASFILPAAVITGAFAWAYVRFGTMTQAVSALAGVKAAVIAVIAIAIWRLGKTAVKSVGLAALGALSLAAFFLGVNPIAILFGGGLIGMLAIRVGNIRAAGALLFSPLLTQRTFTASFSGGKWTSWLRPLSAVALVSAATGVARPSVYKIGLFFLKVGAVLYGGGYVLLAFLEQGLVRQHAWLTHQQLLDAVAIGQFTPGPVLSTATFIGYLLGGMPWSSSSHGGDFSALVFLCRTAGAGAVPVEAVRMDGGVSRFGECLRCCANGWRSIPAGSRCVAQHGLPG